MALESKDKVQCGLCGKSVPESRSWFVWMVKESGFMSDKTAFHINSRTRLCSRCLAAARQQGYTPVINKQDQRILKFPSKVGAVNGQ